MTLHQWMARKGFKDVDVAERVKMTRSQIHRIRTGFSAPKLENAQTLAKLTGIPVHKFLTKEAGDPTAKKDRVPREQQAAA